MDLMTLAAKITLDDSKFTQGVSQAEKTGKNLAGKMSAMTVAVGNLAADMVKKGVSAIGTVINGAIDGVADYEQLIGGVETLFRESAGIVEGYAKESFKNTGLSANQYMDTVTKFSASLLQGLSGDTKMAAEIANMAVTDMADNANKMGTDIASIQNAYQGFAKQNYTMLDNLRLGYGGTRSEMIRLINDSGILKEEISSLDGITFDQIIQAIHAVQEQMGITGTTALEAADTISGSKNSLKAAWQDMLTAVGGAGDENYLTETLDNFKEAFSTYMNNFLPALVETVANSGSLVEAVADAVADLPENLMAQIAQEGLGSGAKMIEGVSKITSWLIENIANTFESAKQDPTKVAEFGKAVGDFIGTAIADIITNVPTILEGIIAVGSNLAGGLIDGLGQGLFGEEAEVAKIRDSLMETLTDVEYDSYKNTGLIKYLKDLNAEYGSAATATEAWKSAVAELKESMPESEGIFESFGSDIEGAIAALEQLNQKMRETAIQAALQKSLQDAWSLYTEQMIGYETEQARYNRNKAVMDSMMGPLQQAAAAQLAAMKQYESTWTNPEQELAKRLEFITNGFDEFGNSLDDLSFEGFKQMLKLFDEEIFSTEQLAGMEKAFAEAQNNMKSAKENMDALTVDMEATKTMIADIEAGVNEAAVNLSTSLNTVQTGIDSGGTEVSGALGTTASGISSGGTSVAGALAGVASAISAISFPSSVGGGGDGGDIGGGTGHGARPSAHLATGIDFVPYNGFNAELHRGEAVLTRSQADKYRNGGGTGYSSINEMINESIASAMGRVNFMLNGEKVADLTSRRTKRNINASTYNKLRAMGG